MSAEGARDALGPVGPTDLDASQHRGMLKSEYRKSARPKASRARCLIGLLRAAPGGLTFQAPPLSTAKAYPPLRDQVIAGAPVTGAGNAITGPRDVREGTPGQRGLNRRREKSCAASPTLPPGHRIPPRVWRRLIRRPSVTGRDGSEYDPYY